MTASLFESKTMRLVMLTMALIVLIFVVAALLDAFAGVHAPYVSETMAALTGNSGIGTYRNIQTDGPIRQAAAASQLSPPIPPSNPPAGGQ